MRFGIMEMQLSRLIPADLPLQSLPQYAQQFDHGEHVRKIAQVGFRSIELNGDLPIFFPGAYSPAAIGDLARLKTELGLAYTVHLPLWSVEPSTLQAPVREGSVAVIIRVIEQTLPLDPDVYVIHATGALAAEFYRMRLPDTARAALLSMFQANAAASLKAILAATGLPSRKLALETIEFPLDLTIKLAEQFDCSICLDTGHVLAGFSGPADLFSVVDLVSPRLTEIHLHDSPWQGPDRHIAYGKDHQALGKGDLDVARFFSVLEKNHFQGPLVFELSIEDALASLRYIDERKTSAD